MSDPELFILYVDDEALLLDITSLYLKSLGLRVDTAESGRQALKKINETRYDAIVSDYQMPEMDGITLLKEIRIIYPEIPFILFTGRGREEVVIQAIECGADFYLQKGGSPRPQYTELSHKIRTAVQQRRASAALRESEARFNQVALSAGEWIWEIDETGLFRYCNSAVEQILGYKPEELVGQKCFFDLYEPVVKEEQTKTAFEAIQGMQSIRNRIFFYQHKNGQKVILQSSGTPTTGEDGKVTGYRGVHMDVTARKKSEELVRLHEKRLVKAQEIGKTGNWEYDLKTGLIWGSEGGLRIFGYHRPAGDISIEEIENCIVERERVHQVLVDLITSGTPYNLEYTINPADASPPKTIASIAGIEPDDEGGRKVVGVIQDITERKKAEEEIRRMNEDISAAYEELTSSEEELRANYRELAESQDALTEKEALFRGLYEIMPSGAAIYRVINDGSRGSDYIIVEMNREALEMEKKDRSQVEGRTLTDLRPAIDEYGLIPVFRKVWLTGEPAIYPAKIYRDENYERWYENYVFKLSSGEIVAIYNDVTEQVETSGKLAQSEKHYRLLAENMKDVIWILDPDTLIFRYVSPSSYLLRGYTPEEVMALPLDKALSEEDAENIKNLIKERKQQFYAENERRQFYVDEAQQHRKDGSLIWTEITTSYYLNEDTGKLEILGLSRDISARKAVEHSLAESHEKYQVLFELGSEAIFLIDNATGELLEANSEASELYGYTREELLSMCNTDLSAEPEDTRRVTVETPIGSIVIPLRFHKRKNGEVFPVEVTGRFFTWKGRPVHVAAIRDISGRKRSEDALIRANRQLSLLTDITRHDILNVITTIFGYLELIRDENTSPEVEDQIEHLNQAVRRIQEQIEFTRVYQDLGATHPRWFSLSLLVRDEDLPAGLELQTEVDGIEIYADPMLEKVFTNLIDNTVRYAKNATTIRISSRISGSEMVLSYEDNGSGIPEDEKDKIFERGYGKNTGLGLFLVREILGITDITIAETGQEGSGARFELTVPKGTYRTDPVLIERKQSL
ncbi:PAS domain S-box protein [uncultured Methanospirillum sp.]|uniref:PAS domain S-box protein n=1 Tax=uncultured Methanospirillum sp. TaxID=262503 RepID=UPI0029C7D013|nr:PAS domain S-box protein [uncultured Methanospirillum sp.]